MRNVAYPLPDPLPKEREKILAFYSTVWLNVSMDTLTDVLGAISHPSRRAILARLAAGPARVTEIAVAFDMSLYAVVQQRQGLQSARLLGHDGQGGLHLVAVRAEPLLQIDRCVEPH